MSINDTFVIDYGADSPSSLPIPSASSTTPACDVFYEYFPDPSSSLYTIVPFAIFYSIIFLLGLMGNVAIIYVTLKHRTLQTVQNMFILNLAASDIIVCLLSLPITPVTNIYKNWFFGSLLCRLIPWVQGVSIFICTFSLGAIAVDRYILVVHPHTPPLSKQGALYVTAILWSLSIIVTIPYAVYMYVETYEGICGCFCTEKWPNASSRRAYTMVVMTAQFVLPFALMAFCYATIFSRLRNRAKVKLRKMDACSHALESAYPSSSPIPNKNERAIEQKTQLIDQKERGRHRLLAQTRRTTCILAGMVIIFGLTWLPHNVVSIIIEYDDNRTFFIVGQWDISYLVNLFTHSIAMTNNIANPVLYAWLNPTFRQLVIETCFGRKPRRNVAVEQKPLPSKNNENHSRFTSFVTRPTVVASLMEEERKETVTNENGVTKLNGNVIKKIMERMTAEPLAQLKNNEESIPTTPLESVPYLEETAASSSEDDGTVEVIESPNNLIYLEENDAFI